jgi:ABC-type protease/lipase transport system fused ATPase/permease subunit
MRNDQTNMAARRKNSEKLAKRLRGLFVFVFSMSGLINLLALTGSFYMMQIYDRAIPSRNIPTLLALSSLAIGLYVFQGVFETIRSQILVRVGANMDRQLTKLQSICHGLASLPLSPLNGEET